MAQVLLLMLMAGILFGFWTEDPDTGQTEFQIHFLPNDPPLLVKLDVDRLQVINSYSGKTVFKRKVDIDRSYKDRRVGRKWFDWPSLNQQRDSVTPREYSSPNAWLHCNETVAVVYQLDYEDRVVDRYRDRYTIFDIRTGKAFFWINERSNQSASLNFERVDSFICAIHTSYVNGFPPTKKEAQENPQRFATFITAFNTSADGAAISDQQKQRAISQSVQKEATDYTPHPQRDFAVLQHLHQWNRDGITIQREQTSEQIARSEINRNSIIRMEDWGISIWDQSLHWFVHLQKQQARPIAWPFGAGSTFRIETGPDNLQALIGVWNVPSGTSFRTTERRVFWNLEAENFHVLPNDEVRDVEVFGQRALCTTQRGAYWLDLKSGAIAWIRGTGPSQQFTKFVVKLIVIALWCTLWIWLVKPFSDRDQTRRFGLFFFALILGALTIRHVDRLGFRQDWLLSEWLSSIAFFIPLLGLLLTATFRKTVSPLMLAITWPTCLLLLASLLRFGESMTYDQLSTSGQPDITLREQVWLRLTRRDSLTEVFEHEPGQRPRYFDYREKKLRFVSDSTAPNPVQPAEPKP